MIGVIPRTGQEAVVEEFFQLFKTPWEIYRPDCRYDAVVATSDAIPIGVEATVLLVYGAAELPGDARSGLVAASRHRGTIVDLDGVLLPIHGDVLTFHAAATCQVRVTAASGTFGVRCGEPNLPVVRLGYDVFEEIRILLVEGQPADHAHAPALDLHISLMRSLIVEAGVPLLEIPPVPAGHEFAACLTHDIDFIGIRQHWFDHSMWGFLYRSTVGAVRDLLRSRISAGRALKMWRAAVLTPAVYLGWAEDFWDPFPWYLQVEENLPATYYLIPFKGRAGERVPGRHPSRRAAKYDVTELSDRARRLARHGCEVGVHGIDAWHSVEQGRQERARIDAAIGKSAAGIRMHWLLRDAETPGVLEEAGYEYDSTVGYNETVGYRAGTSQVFRPPAATALLELPLHIQDGALFYRQQLDLPEAEAWLRCEALLQNAGRFGGVVTVLWHDRSHGPERFWGDFYIRLVRALKSRGAWFGTAADIVDWFRSRRSIRFVQLQTTDGLRSRVSCDGPPVNPAFRVRIHHASGFTDAAWDGAAAFDVRPSAVFSS